MLVAMLVFYSLSEFELETFNPFNLLAQSTKHTLKIDLSPLGHYKCVIPFYFKTVINLPLTSVTLYSYSNLNA